MKKLLVGLMLIGLLFGQTIEQRVEKLEKTKAEAVEEMQSLMAKLEALQVRVYRIEGAIIGFNLLLSDTSDTVTLEIE